MRSFLLRILDVGAVNYTKMLHSEQRGCNEVLSKRSFSVSTVCPMLRTRKKSSGKK